MIGERPEPRVLAFVPLAVCILDRTRHRLLVLVSGTMDIDTRFALLANVCRGAERFAMRSAEINGRARPFLRPAH